MMDVSPLSLMQRKKVLAAGEVKGLYGLIDVHNTNKLLNGTVTVARIELDTEGATDCHF